MQRWLPQHWLNRLARLLAESTNPRLAQSLIRFWLRRFQVDLSEAMISDPKDYRRFNQFFVRRLKRNARHWPEDPSLLTSPVDGTLGEVGRIQSSTLLQAKQHRYKLEELLASPQSLRHFEGCGYATLYLAPRDYHRIHMPVSGRLIGSQHIAGSLFSVSPRTANLVPRLYARNRRAICLFSSEAGTFAMVLVGALIVGRIRLAWERSAAQTTDLRDWSRLEMQLQRGAQVGMFELGSTVVLIAPRGYEWSEGVAADNPVRLGQPLAQLRRN